MSAGMGFPLSGKGKMPDSLVRRAMEVTRREGRRSLAAYEPQARGSRVFGGDNRGVPSGAAQPRGSRGAAPADVSNAGIALALVYPLVRYPLVRRVHTALGMTARSAGEGGKGANMKQRKPSIASLETVTLEEAQAYIAYATGDELEGAYALARDRNKLDGSASAPDDAEVHHALFLLCRALGKVAPSFDQMRVELRRRVAA